MLWEICRRCRLHFRGIQRAPLKLAWALHGQISSANAAECWKICSRKSTLLPHCLLFVLRAAFFLPIGSFIPCFCCWGGNEGAAGNSGNWIFYYYFKNVALIEQPRAVLYTDVIPKKVEAHVPEIKMTVKLRQMGSWAESHERGILQGLQWEIQAGQGTVRTRTCADWFFSEFETVTDAMSISNS